MTLIFLLFTLLVFIIIVPTQLMGQANSLSDVESSLSNRLAQLKKDFQFRSKELARRKKLGDLADDEWQTLSNELESETLSSIESTKQAQADSIITTSWSNSIVIMIVLLSVAGVSYFQFGSYESSRQQLDLAVRINNEEDLIDTLSQTLAETKSQDAINELYLAMRTMVDIQPKNIDGWRSLAIFNSNYNRIPEALQAINQAVKLSPNDHDLIIERAHILALSENRSDLFLAFRIIHDVLKEDAKHEGALLLLANLSFNFGLYNKAIQSWQTLIASIEPSNEMYPVLEERIAEARRLLSDKESNKVSNKVLDKQSAKISKAHNSASATGQSNSTSLNNTASIQVKINIADEISSKLKGTETLFILAKAVGAGNFPVAVIRTTVKELSKSFTLSDANAMRPAMKLSQFEKVIVTVRISKSGNAIPQNGDAQGSSSVISKPFDGQAIVINLDQIVKK